jgi:hypothetical protein
MPKYIFGTIDRNINTAAFVVKQNTLILIKTVYLLKLNGTVTTVLFSLAESQGFFLSTLRLTVFMSAPSPNLHALGGTSPGVKLSKRGADHSFPHST